MALAPTHASCSRAHRASISVCLTSASLLADGPCSILGGRYYPAVTPDGTTVLVSEHAGQNIRQIDLATGAVSTLAGSLNRVTGHVDGTGTNAQFNSPVGIVIMPDGLTALVADRDNHRVRSIVLATGATTTLAGSGSAGSSDGTGVAASFNMPTGIALTPDGSTIFVAEHTGNKVRKIVLGTGVVTTFASGFNKPPGVAVSPDGSTLYVSDR